MRAIFMVGEQRSGSNLLRLIVNSSAQVAAPHPPHILQHLMPLMPHYGNLDEEPVMRRLVDDVCRLVEYNPVPWDGISRFDRDEVRTRCRDNSLVAVFGAVMDIYAEVHGAGAWMCKSMQNIRWAGELNAYFERPKFIYLYRDPRDVALSFSKAVIGDKHPYCIARKWVELQKLCLEAGNWLPRDQFFRLRYEDLIRDSQQVLSNLCRFLDIDFTEEMLSFHMSKEAARTAGQSTLWANLSQPLIAANSQKFVKDMPEEQVAIIESVAGDVMDRLGYERFAVARGHERVFSEAQVARFEHENKTRQARMAKQTDPADQQRRQRQLSIVENIRAFTTGAVTESASAAGLDITGVPAAPSGA